MNYSNQLLFKNFKAYSSFLNNIWGAYLFDVQLLYRYKEWICFLLFFINLYSKYAWVVPLKDKNGKSITKVSVTKSKRLR